MLNGLWFKNEVRTAFSSPLSFGSRHCYHEAGSNLQIDIQTFGKIERLLEDYALGQLIEENDQGESLTVAEANEFYKSLVQ